MTPDVKSLSESSLSEEIKTHFMNGILSEEMEYFLKLVKSLESEVARLTAELFEEQTRRAYWETAEKQEKEWRVEAEARVASAKEWYKDIICEKCIRPDRPCLCDIAALKFEEALCMEEFPPPKKKSCLGWMSWSVECDECGDREACLDKKLSKEEKP